MGYLNCAHIINNNASFICTLDFETLTGPHLMTLSPNMFEHAMTVESWRVYHLFLYTLEELSDGSVPS